MLTDAEARSLAAGVSRFGAVFRTLAETGAVMDDGLLCDIDRLRDLADAIGYTYVTQRLAALADYARHHAGRGPVPGWPSTTNMDGA